MKELEDHFINERNVVLFSWRRIGKTALLKCFLTDVEKMGKTETLYVDLLGTCDMSIAIGRITQSVYECYGETSSGISSALKNFIRQNRY